MPLSTTPVGDEGKRTVLDEFLLEDHQWPKYTGYQALSQEAREIRLLRIWLEEDTNLCGRIEHASLNSPPVYEALSYYWGPPSWQMTIQLSGELVSIRASLHSFLQTLCESKASFMIWVDSLCINQRDIDERNWQVAMMGEIYHCAIRTNVWLGDTDADTEYVFAYLQSYEVLKHEIFSKGKGISRRVCNCLPQLASRPYWSRMWIVQEIGLAKDVHVFCGSRSVSWSTLVDGLAALFGTGENPYRPLSTTDVDITQQATPLAFISNLEELRKTLADSKPDRKHTIFDRVSQFGHLKCQDERDKMFAMIGLVEPEERISIDYHKTVADIILDTLCSRLHRRPPRSLAYSASEVVNVLQCVGESTLKLDPDEVLMSLREGDEIVSWYHYSPMMHFQNIAWLQETFITFHHEHSSAVHARTLNNELASCKPSKIKCVLFHLPVLKNLMIGLDRDALAGVLIAVGQSQFHSNVLEIQGILCRGSAGKEPEDLLLMDSVFGSEIQVCHSTAIVDGQCMIKLHYSRWAIIIMTYILTGKATFNMLGKVRALHRRLRRQRPLSSLCKCQVNESENEEGLRLFRAAFDGFSWATIHVDQT